MRKSFRINSMAGTIGAAVIGAVALAVSGPALAVEEIKVTAISGHPPVIAVVKFISKLFIPEVDKRLAKTGKYKIKWTQAYAGTVAKVPAVFEAIGSGVADMGHVFMGAETAKMPLEAITYVTPFGTAVLGKQLDVVTKLHEAVPQMAKEFEKHNQVLIALAGVDSYHLFTKYPIKTLDDLKGHKFGVPGSAANWLKNTGAVAVRGNLTTYYNSLKTGVYDGIVLFSSGALPNKFYQVAPNMIQTNLGAMFSAVLSVNKDRWDAFPTEVQKAFREVGLMYTRAVGVNRTAAGKKTAGVWKKNGGTVIALSDAERARWAKGLPNIAKIWAAAQDKKGLPGTKILNTYMDLARKAGIKFARDWDKE